VSGASYLLLLFGLFALLLACSRWLVGRRWAAAGNLALALLLFLIVHRTGPAAANLATYDRLPSKGTIAQVGCERTGPRSYRVTLTRLPGGRMQVFEVAGDEWRLDVRTLAWKDLAARVGMQPSFRLDRLSSRYVRGPRPADGPAPLLQPASFGLSEGDESGVDVWAQARTATRWERYADARHAYGPWRPLVAGGRFEVRITREADGTATVDARPANEAARKAMRYTGSQRGRTQG
jgi:hypothetical protein